jgi:hypothetical protein
VKTKVTVPEGSLRHGGTTIGMLQPPQTWLACRGGWRLSG